MSLFVCTTSAASLAMLCWFRSTKTSLCNRLICLVPMENSFTGCVLYLCHLTDSPVPSYRCSHKHWQEVLQVLEVLKVQHAHNRTKWCWNWSVGSEIADSTFFCALASTNTVSLSTMHHNASIILVMPTSKKQIHRNRLTDFEIKSTNRNNKMW